MSLLSVYADSKNYRIPSFNREQSRSVFGENVANQFDVNCEAKSYRQNWSPLDVTFVVRIDSELKALYPDISEHNGRLILTEKAYRALKDIMEDDGEFLPVKIDGQDGFIFNPLKIAEDVNGLDEKLSIKNEWGDIENTAFHEHAVSDFMLFRARFGGYRDLFCQDSFMNAVKEAGLNGVFFTPDLGDRFSIEMADRLRNG